MARADRPRPSFCCVTGAGRVSWPVQAPGAKRARSTARSTKPGHFVARRATVFAGQQSIAVGRPNVLRARGACAAQRSSSTLTGDDAAVAPVGLPQPRADRASRRATLSTGAVEHDSGGDRAPGGNAALGQHSNAHRPRTRECLRRSTPPCARGNHGAPDPTNTNITRAGFTGHDHDNDLGLIDMKGRVYDPLAARFTTADPIMQAPCWSQGMNRYAYVFNDPINATDPSGFIGMSEIVGGFVAAGHLAAMGLAAVENGSVPSLAAVAAPTAGSSAVTVPGLLQGQPGSSGTVLPSGPDLRLAQNMGDPRTGTDIPGNVPDTVARPDVPPQLGPSEAALVALPRTLIAIAEAAEAWLVRAGAALRAIGPALSMPEAVMASTILVPGDSVVRAEGYTGRVGKIAEGASKQLGRRVTPREVKDAIHGVKDKGLGRGGPISNPDVRVHPGTGDVKPEIPGGDLGDSIGNIYDFLR